ncbi:hypothetical protein SCALM49S_06517 [Streptomyces californicus]
MSTSKSTAARPVPLKGGRRTLTLPVVLLIIAGGLALVSLAAWSAAPTTSPRSARSPARWSSPSRSASPDSAACGPSARASSTSASKA